jgi:hypothetical protein
MLLRKCKKCGAEAYTEKELKNFASTTGRSKYGRENKCKPCKNLETVQYFNARDKEKYNKHKKNRARANKLKSILYKGGKCNRCQVTLETLPQSAFEFHHLNPDEKEKEPAKVMRMSWDNIKKEIDKCILVCANCHRIIHAEEKE